MTTSVTASEPKKPESVAVEARKAVSASKTGHDLWRPFRYTFIFLGGTLNDGLNGLAKWGNKGLKFGIALGVVTAIATGGLAPLFALAMAGFVSGVALGGAHGVLTGGMRAINRTRRGELYAEDLIDRAKIRDTTPAPRTDYRTAYQKQQRRNSFITQQVLEREAEVKRDSQTYGGNSGSSWQDRTQASHADRGVGF